MRKLTKELRMKQDTDLEKKSAQNWEPGKEEGNEREAVPGRQVCRMREK